MANGGGGSGEHGGDSDATEVAGSNGEVAPDTPQSSPVPLGGNLNRPNGESFGVITEATRDAMPDRDYDAGGGGGGPAGSGGNGTRWESTYRQGAGGYVSRGGFGGGPGKAVKVNNTQLLWVGGYSTVRVVGSVG